MTKNAESEKKENNCFFKKVFKDNMISHTY